MRYERKREVKNNSNSVRSKQLGKAFEHVKCELCLRCPSRDVKEAVQQKTQEFREVKDSRLQEEGGDGSRWKDYL